MTSVVPAPSGSCTSTRRPQASWLSPNGRPAGKGAAYVDGFCLESSFSNAQPASGPGATSSSVNTLAPGQQLLQSLTLDAGTQAISVVAEPASGVGIQLVLIDPSGAVLQTADASSGFAVIEAPAGAGVYLVKLVNAGLAPVNVWMAATPLVSR